MLPESLLYITAASTREARRLGLVGDAVALWSRATRCRAAWAPHEAQCHAAVTAAIADLERARTVLVLGSGLLRDVPLAALVARFRRVILVDAVHLWPARRASRSPRVERVAADLTGVAGWLAGEREGRSDPLDRRDPLAAFRADPDIDFVLSADVLSQLPMAVERWRERHQDRAATLPDDIARRIVAWHLDDLTGWSGRVCLLTDVRHQEIERGGRVVDETDLLFGETLPPPDAAWDWEVAPAGELDRHTAHHHRVHAYHDLARSRGRHRPGVSHAP